MKKLISLALALTMVLSLAACGGGSTSTAPAASNAPAASGSTAAPAAESYKCKIGTGSSGGVFYVLGAAMAEVINKDSTILNLTAQATSATSENIAFTTSKELDFAFAIYDVVQAAYTGTREYESTGALDNVRIVMMGHVGDVCPIVFADSPIQSLADLADDKYSIGVTSGYAGYVLTKACLAGYGINIDDLSEVPVLSYSEQATALKDGTLDVQMYTGAHPGSAVLDSASVKPIRILGQTEEALKKTLTEFPYFVANTVPAGTYDGLDEDDDEPENVWLFTTAMKLLALLSAILFFFPMASSSTSVYVSLFTKNDSISALNLVTGTELFGVAIDGNALASVLLIIPLVIIALLYVKDVLPKFIASFSILGLSVFEIIYLTSLSSTIEAIFEKIKDSADAKYGYITSPTLDVGYNYTLVVFVLIALGAVVMIGFDIVKMMRERKSLNSD